VVACIQREEVEDFSSILFCAIAYVFRAVIPAPNTRALEPPLVIIVYDDLDFERDGIGHLDADFDASARLLLDECRVWVAEMTHKAGYRPALQSVHVYIVDVHKLRVVQKSVPTVCFTVLILGGASTTAGNFASSPQYSPSASPTCIAVIV